MNIGRSYDMTMYLVILIELLNNSIFIIIMTMNLNLKKQNCSALNNRAHMGKLNQARYI